MSLQVSGAISLANIQAEFGGANPISISEYYGVNGVPASGPISLGDFYGASAFNAIWSGNSAGTQWGFKVSGSLFRMFYSSFDNAPWISAFSSGTFTNGDTFSTNGFSQTSGFYSGGNLTSPNGLKAKQSTGIATEEVLVTSGVGFTGNSYGGTNVALETSGGLIRYANGANKYAWVSLT